MASSNKVTVIEFDIIGASPLMFGKAVVSEKLDDETHEQHANRCWQEKVNIFKGQCFIQSFALKNALSSAAKRLSMKLDGKKTFTKLFDQGIMVVERMLLLNGKGQPMGIDDVVPQHLFVPVDGKRGSSKRVMRVFPIVEEWSTHAQVVVYDQRITSEIMQRHAEEVGRYIGFGSMRVENGGVNGRFLVNNITQSAIV